MQDENFSVAAVVFSTPVILLIAIIIGFALTMGGPPSQPYNPLLYQSAPGQKYGGLYYNGDVPANPQPTWKQPKDVPGQYDNGLNTDGSTGGD